MNYRPWKGLENMSKKESSMIETHKQNFYYFSDSHVNAMEISPDGQVKLFDFKRFSSNPVIELPVIKMHILMLFYYLAPCKMTPS